MKRSFMSREQRQRGAATLVVVMVLFLVMALLAAYANRSLMFEQRISGSYYRASMAQELAEGGVEWTLAMLNGAALDDDCKPVATGGTRFVDKYLNVSAADRATTSKVTTALPGLAVDCSATGAGLVCRCPAANARTTQPGTAVNGELVPSFGLALGTNTHYGSFQVIGYGCTDSSVDNCVFGDQEARSQKAAAMSLQKVSIGFVGAVPSSPAAPLTVKGVLTTLGAGGLGLHNTDPRSAGLLVVSGGGAPALNEDRLDSVPGTPSSQARVFDDVYLHSLGNNTQDNTKFFRNFMGMAPSRYRNHPAAYEVACAGGSCGTQLLAAYDAGQRILIVRGAMAVDSNVTLGTVAAPVLIVVEGDVDIAGPMQLNGMLVVLGDLRWANGGGGGVSQVTGMVVVQGDMVADGRMDIVYRQSVASELRNRVGSYARVSGGWIDEDTK
ncbi:hypothetical protein ASC95_26880 [Pelomonas sp. Root1217]|nr:hypothetical protein ASC95_26880 [Pelomonas sp. Root1217]